MKKKAALIARVSTGTQDYKRQVEDLTALASSMGYEIPQEYIYTEKISGLSSSDERQALVNIINDIKSTEKIEMVFTESANRIARKPSVGHKFVEDLTDLGIPVYISNMNCASLYDNGVKNKAFFIQYAMLLEFARIDAEELKLKFKSGKLNSIKEGRVIGGEHIIYGYQRGEKIDRKAPKYIINSDEAKVVKTIYKMYINGSGCKIIANYLNGKKQPSKTGGEWTLGTISQILNNPFYYGARRWDGKIYENTVPAIITKEEFEQVRKIALEREQNPEKNVKYLYLLKNKTYCGHCGAKYHAKFKPQKHSHYMCYNRSSNTNKKTCLACGIGIDKIESLVWFLVKMHMGVYEYLQKHGENVKKNQHDIENLKLKIAAYETEIQMKTQQIKRWNRLFTIEKIEEDELSIEVGKLQSSIKSVSQKLISINKEIAAKQALVSSGSIIEQYTSLMKTIGNDRVKINEIMKNVLNKVIITSTHTGQYCDTFIVSVYTIDGLMPSTVLFDKKQMLFWDNTMGGVYAINNYDANNRFNGNMQKLVKYLKKPSYGTTVIGERVLNKNPLNVPLVPFTRLNILNGNQPV
jgi:DNA invertase Pin-like site-specific DNA recombinase